MLRTEIRYLTHPERLLVELAKIPGRVVSVQVVPDVVGDGARVYAEVVE